MSAVILFFLRCLASSRFLVGRLIWVLPRFLFRRLNEAFKTLHINIPRLHFDPLISLLQQNFNPLFLLFLFHFIFIYACAYSTVNQSSLGIARNCIRKWWKTTKARATSIDYLFFTFYATVRSQMHSVSAIPIWILQTLNTFCADDRKKKLKKHIKLYVWALKLNFDVLKIRILLFITWSAPVVELL